jgi:Ca2+-transporting ATPase
MLLTGDRAETAARVGQEVGITRDAKVYLTGSSMDRMDSAEIARQAAYCSIFARLLPSQKGFLIRLLQQRNHKVAMIGDGPNDGIALKVANIGISYFLNSSPIARRLSKILINDLADLSTLIESARRIKKRDAYLKIFRNTILVGTLLGSYLWVFSLR